MFTTRSEYDRGVNTYSPEGRLFQVEYAMGAIKLGTTCIGICCKEGVVLASELRLGSKLLETAGIDKIVKIDDHIGCAMSGLVADARILVDHARVMAANCRYNYDESVSVKACAEDVANLALDFSDTRESKKKSMSRPSGVALIFAGVDTVPSIWTTDPSGTCTNYKAAAMGAAQESAEAILCKEYREDLTLKECISISLITLQQVMEEKLTSSTVELVVVPTCTGKYKKFPRAELDEIINELPEDETVKAQNIAKERNH